MKSRVQAVRQIGICETTRDCFPEKTPPLIPLFGLKTMSEPEGGGEEEEEGRRGRGRETVITKFMIEKALWNCCVSLSLTEILPNLYLGGYVPLPTLLFPPFPFESK